MLSEALRLIRVFHDLKQAQLAERLAISKSYLSEIESGAKVPSLDLIKRYSEEFNMPISSIMFFAEKLPDAERGEKVRAAIAGKVISLLKFIEERSDSDAA